MRLFLVRHGESENNLNRSYTGQFDTELTDKGRAQAIAIRPLLDHIHFYEVYSSDLKRAFETSQLALPNYTAKKTPLLREFNMGSFTNTPFEMTTPSNLGEDIYRQIKSSNYTHFGGEDVPMVVKRATEFLKQFETEEDKNIIAFAHGGFIMSAIYSIMGEQSTLPLRRPNCMIAVFEFLNGKWMLSSWVDPSIFVENFGTHNTDDKIL